MNFALKTILFFIFLGTSTSMYAQNEPSPLSGSGGISTICPGDTMSIGTIVGNASLQNITEYFGFSCNSTCESNDIDPHFTGDGIISESIGAANYNYCDINSPFASPLTAEVSPSMTTTYRIEWSTTFTQVHCDTDEVNTFPATYYYEHTIVVVDLEFSPILLTENVIAGSESFEVMLNGLEAGMYYSHNVNSRSQCINYSNNHGWSNEENRVITEYGVPNFTGPIEYEFQVFTHQVTSNPLGCYGEWIPLTINIQENLDSEPCDDPSIANTESMLGDSVLISSRQDIDYHNYTVVNSVCNMDSESNCSLNEVWTFLNSNISYQTPLPTDFEDPISNGVNGLINYLGEVAPNNGNFPVQNCDIIYLKHHGVRRLLGGLSLLPSVDITLYDPVRIVVDNDSKCITNYTLEGHILHPGKIRRCLVVNDCNEIEIVTTGTGFHWTYDSALFPNWASTILRNENIAQGGVAFQNIDDRFISEFNNE